MAVVGAQQTEFNARHQHETLLSARKGRVSFRLKLPFVVLHPAIFLLLFLGECGRFGVVGQVAIVFAVPFRPRWSYCNRCHELRTLAGEHGIVRRTAAKRKPKVDVVGVAVAHNEVAPVLQHVSCVRKVHRQHEVIVGPTQPLAPSHRCAKHLYVLVGVVIVFVIVVIAAPVAVHRVVISVAGTVVVIVAVYTCLLRVEHADVELQRTFASKPSR